MFAFGYMPKNLFQVPIVPTELLDFHFACSESFCLLLANRYPELQQVAAASPSKLTELARSSETLSSLLAVSPQHLDADAELRKFFGSKVVAASKTSGSDSRARRQPAVAQRSQLTKPKPGWWPAQAREGLSLRSLTPEEVAEKQERHGWNVVNERWWTVEYSKKYKACVEMTSSFCLIFAEQMPTVSLWRSCRP
jgi:hypothetical protein